jgi:transcriptional regulator with XRE-family HTH domain
LNIDDIKPFAAVLRDYLKTNKLTQTDLAKQLLYHRQWISDLSRGNGRPGKRFIWTLAIHIWPTDGSNESTVHQIAEYLFACRDCKKSG